MNNIPRTESCGAHPAGEVRRWSLERRQEHLLETEVLGDAGSYLRQG